MHLNLCICIAYANKYTTEIFQILHSTCENKCIYTRHIRMYISFSMQCGIIRTNHGKNIVIICRMAIEIIFVRCYNKMKEHWKNFWSICAKAQVLSLETVTKGRNSSIEWIIRSGKRKIRRFTGCKSRIWSAVWTKKTP